MQHDGVAVLGFHQLLTETVFIQVAVLRVCGIHNQQNVLGQFTTQSM